MCAGRMVAIAIGLTVLSWTGSQAWIFNQESRKADLILLTKSRRLSELALEQGLFASLTPLRDVAGLADNLPLLVIASILVFRASFEIPGWGVQCARDRNFELRRLRQRRLVNLGLGMRVAVCTLPSRSPNGRQYRFAAGELPSRRGPDCTAFDGDM